MGKKYSATRALINDALIVAKSVSILYMYCFIFNTFFFSILNNNNNNNNF